MTHPQKRWRGNAFDCRFRYSPSTTGTAKDNPVMSTVLWSTCRSIAMDTDLEEMSRDQLIAEVRKLRAAIRKHRDSSGHELCWHHPDLWALLPEKTDPVPVVPEWAQFLRGCIRYRQSLDKQAPDAPRTSTPYDEDNA
jgi:hypothetical protein